MRLMNEKEVIKDAIAGFCSTWGDGSYGTDRRSRNVGAELNALDLDTATVGIVNEIIGNTSWTIPLQCVECGVMTYEMVEFGDADESVCICNSCIKKALILIKGQNNENHE